MTFGSVNRPTHTHTHTHIYIYQTFTLREILKRRLHTSAHVLCSKQYMSTEIEGNFGRRKYSEWQVRNVLNVVQIIGLKNKLKQIKTN